MQPIRIKRASWKPTSTSLFILVMLVMVTACATSPTGRNQLLLFPEAQLDSMGQATFQQIKQQTPVDQTPSTNAYVSCIARAILAVLPAEQGQGWEVDVFNSDDVNAFALPGKKIGVYRGMLSTAASPAQLAAVIGHEVGHVQAQHSNERVSTEFATDTGLQLISVAAGAASPAKHHLFALLGVGAQVGVLLPYSRKQESEADTIGMQLMAKAGFDPRESVELWRIMQAQGGNKPPELLSTHPSNQRRIDDLNGQLAKVLPLYNSALQQRGKPECKK